MVIKRLFFPFFIMAFMLLFLFSLQVQSQPVKPGLTPQIQLIAESEYGCDEECVAATQSKYIDYSEIYINSICTATNFLSQKIQVINFLNIFVIRGSHIYIKPVPGRFAFRRCSMHAFRKNKFI